ncbi:MAG: PKD domain-containing protein [Candidatus Hydrogenedentes bacterium]|nr:PKD domain-containing protein [Candidatus Hydrogenedentota bacterium]
MRFTFYSLLIFLTTVVSFTEAEDIPLKIEHSITPLSDCRAQSYIDVIVEINYTGESPLLSLGLRETIPTGTSYYGIVGGNPPHIQPPFNTEGQLDFAWIFPPQMPTSFTYRLTVNSSLDSENVITSTGIYGTTETPEETPPIQFTFNCPIMEGEIPTEGEETEGEEVNETVTFNLSTNGEPEYIPEKEIEVIVTITYPPTLGITALGAKIFLPQSWSYLRVEEGSYLPPITPQPGSTGELGFAWVTIPPSGTSFSLIIKAGEEISSTKELTGYGLYRILEGQINTSTATVVFNLGPLPDLAFSNGKIYPERVYNGGLVEISYTTKNLGNSILNAGWYDRVYISTDNKFDESDTLISCEYRNGIIQPEETFDVKSLIHIPSHLIGTFYLLSKINAQKNFYELTEENNLGILGTVQVTQREYDIKITSTPITGSVGSPIRFQVFTYYPNSEKPYPYKQVDIMFSHRLRKVTKTIQTDNNGEYTYIYTPFSTEGGIYTLEAKSPPEIFYYCKAQSNLSGIGVSPSQLTIPYTSGKSIKISIDMINLGDEEEKNFSIYYSGLPNEWDLDYQLPTTIPGNSIEKGILTIYPNTLLEDITSAEIFFYSEKGSQTPLWCTFIPSTPYPKLEISPSPIDIVASIDKPQITTIEVKNSGGIDTGSINLSILPQSEQISLITGESIPNIKAGESFFISLQTLREQGNNSFLQEYHLLLSSPQIGDINIPIRIYEEYNAKIHIKVLDKTTNEPIRQGLITVLNENNEMLSYWVDSNGEVIIESEMGNITSISCLSHGYKPYAFSPIDRKIREETTQIYLERIPVTQIISFLKTSENLNFKDIKNINSDNGGLTPEFEVFPAYIDTSLKTYYNHNLIIRNNNKDRLLDLIIYPNLSVNKKFEPALKYIRELPPFESIEVPFALVNQNSSTLERSLSGIKYRKSENNSDTEFFLPLRLWNTESIQSDWTISYSEISDLINTDSQIIIIPTSVNIETEDFYYIEGNTSPIPLQFTIDPYYPVINTGEHLHLSISSNISHLNYNVNIQVKARSEEDITPLFSIQELSTISQSKTTDIQKSTPLCKTFKIIPSHEFFTTGEKEVFITVNIEYTNKRGETTLIVSPNIGFLINYNSTFEVHEFFPYKYEEFTETFSVPNTGKAFPVCYMIKKNDPLVNVILVKPGAIYLQENISGKTLTYTLFNSEINHINQPTNQLVHTLHLGTDNRICSGFWILETPDKYTLQEASLDTFNILEKNIYLPSICKRYKHDLLKLIKSQRNGKIQYLFVTNDDQDTERNPDTIYLSTGDIEQIEKVQCNWFKVDNSPLYGIAFRKNSEAPWVYIKLNFLEEINENSAIVRVIEFNGSPLPEQYYWVDKKVFPTLNILFSTSGASGTLYVELRRNQENNHRPFAIVPQSNYEIYRPNTLLLDGTGSYDEDGDNLIFRWQLISRPFHSLAYIKDSNTATPLLIPDVPGEYIIEFKVSDGLLSSDPIYITVNVVNRPPLPNISGLNKVHPKNIVILDASGTQDLDGDPLEFLWRLTSKPNGSKTTLQYIFDSSISFTPDLLGLYEVTLYISDGYDNISTKWNVEAVNNLPQFTLEYPTRVYLNQNVSIRLKNIYDPDNDPISFRWLLQEIPEGSGISLPSSYTDSVSFVADKRGIYKLLLNISDTYEQRDEIITVNCINRNPNVVINANETEISHGDEITIDGSLTSDPDNDELIFNWELTLKPAQSSAELYLIEKKISLLRTDVPGTYKVKLTAEDGYGGTDSKMVSIYATNSSPLCNLPEEHTCYVGTPLVITCKEAEDRENDNIYYVWSIAEKPEGSSPQLLNYSENALFIGDKKGLYKLELEVSDNWGEKSKCYTNIKIINRIPNAILKILTSPIHIGKTVVITSEESFDSDGDPVISQQWKLTSKPPESNSQLSNLSGPETQIIPDKKGIYTIELKVFDGTDWSTSSSIQFSPVNRAPIAQIMAPATFELNQPCILNGSNSFDPDNDNIQFNWRITEKPRQSRAEISNPNATSVSFTPDYPGYYSIRLTVNDGELNSTPTEINLRTPNLPPVARISAPILVEVGEQVTIDGNGSYDPDGDSLSYRWQLVSKPPNSMTSLSSLTDSKTIIYIDQAGSYQVALQVNDGKVFSEIERVFVSTGNEPPVAVVNQDLSGTVGLPCYLDGSKSYDPNNDELIYIWSLSEKPEGSNVELQENDTPNPYFTPDKEGLYEIQLIVSDGRLYSKPAVAKVSTNNSPPIALISSSDVTAKVGDVITLNGAESYDPDGDPLTFTWTLSSKPDGSIATISDSAKPTAVITIDKKGFYQGTLTVKDSANISNSAQFTITCINQPPVAKVTSSQQVFIGQMVTLDASGSQDPDDDLPKCAYEWKLINKPHNSNVNIENPHQLKISFIPDIIGTYNFDFEIKDPENGYDKESVSIEVLCTPPTPPKKVSASDGEHSDKIVITWETSPDAVEYMVFMSTENNSISAVPISNWITSPYWEDNINVEQIISENSPTVSKCGCSNGYLLPCETQNYVEKRYYWVISRVNESCVSSFSECDSGYVVVELKKEKFWEFICKLIRFFSR